MARGKSAARQLPLASFVVGSLVAGIFLPRLLRSGRRAVRSMAGKSFTAGVPGGKRPNADPALGRPA